MKLRKAQALSQSVMKVISAYFSWCNNGYEDLPDLLELTPKRDVLFIIGDWNAKVGSQETPRKQANLALEYGMKQGKG